MEVFKVRNVSTGKFKDRTGWSSLGRVYSSRRAAGCALTKTIHHNGELAGKLTVDGYTLVKAQAVGPVTSDCPSDLDA